MVRAVIGYGSDRVNNNYVDDVVVPILRNMGATADDIEYDSSNRKGVAVDFQSDPKSKMHRLRGRERIQGFFEELEVRVG